MRGEDSAGVQSAHGVRNHGLYLSWSPGPIAVPRGCYAQIACAVLLHQWPTRGGDLGRALGEVVQRKRFARNTLGALQWVRVTMIGKVRGSEHHEPIEHRQNLRLASSHVTIPELKMTA